MATSSDESILIPADGVSASGIPGEEFSRRHESPETPPESTPPRLTFLFWLLVVTQFSTAVTDNLFRWFAVKLGQTTLDDTLVLVLGGLCFVVPFMLLTPLAGSLSDRFSKQRVMTWCKVGEVVGLVFGFAMVWTGNVTGLFVAVAWLGTVNSLFTPAKFGSIHDLLGPRGLGMGNAAIGLATISGAALGTFGGYALYSAAGVTLTETPTPGGLAIAALPMLGVSLLGVVASALITRHPAAAPETSLKFNTITETVPALRVLWKDRVLWRTAIGIAFFWGLASLAQVAIDLYGEQLLELSEPGVGGLMVVLVIGVGLGSVVAGLFCKKKIELGLIPLAALGIVAGSMVMFVAGLVADGSSTPTWWTWAACAGLLVLGFSSGLFDIPLEAYLQQQSKSEIRGTVLAAANFLAYAGMAVAFGVFYLATDGFGWRPETLFLIGAVLTVPVTVYSFFLLPDTTLRFCNWLLSHTLYKVDVQGLENMPKGGGALLICNHISWMDGCLLTAVSPRPVRFMIHSPYTKGVFAGFLAKQAGFIPVDATGGPKQIVAALETAREALRNGEIVCIFPEGALSRTGQLQPFQRGTLKVLKGLDVPVIPAYLAGLWGSIFSFRGGKFFWKWPKRWPYPVTIRVGQPIPNAPQDPAFLRRAVEHVGGDAMNEHHADDAFFLPRFVKACKQAKFRTKVSDTTGVELTGGKLLAGTIAMSRVLGRQPFANDKHVGVLLPPTVGATVANVALAFRGQVGVNLNYTLTNDGVNVCVQKAGLKYVLTSRKFLEKKPYTLDGAEGVFLEDLKTQVTGGDKAMAALAAFVTPAGLLSRRLGFHRRSPDELATIVFTSGSTGNPKGVMLSYGNIASQIHAIDQLFYLTPEDTVLGVLPFFHSYGYSETLWMPLCAPTAVAYHTNPLDAKTVGSLCDERNVSILFATPTFLRTYMKRCKKEQMHHLDLVVVGAEKMPPDLADAFEQKFAVRPTEGYGATELSPFTAVNVPDHRCSTVEQKGTKEGTVGRVMPGSVARTIDIDTGEETPIGTEGLLMIKGPNVMQGYLDEPTKTAEVVHDGWYDTGDLAIIDGEGFIEITGRKSRFSKIGGEMVPHIRVEQAIERIVASAMNEDADSDDVTQAVAIASVPDTKKGERLIVLHRPLPISPEDILAGLAEEQLPNLWLPAADAFYEVDEIPMLGSGKLDLKRLNDLATEKTTAS